MQNETLIKQIDNQDVLDSRDVAKMVGKSHAHLMRDIYRYINDMEMDPKLDSSKFFIESSYVDSMHRKNLATCSPNKDASSLPISCQVAKGRFSPQRM